MPKPKCALGCIDAAAINHVHNNVLSNLVGSMVALLVATNKHRPHQIDQVLSDFSESVRESLAEYMETVNA